MGSFEPTHRRILPRPLRADFSSLQGERIPRCATTTVGVCLSAGATRTEHSAFPSRVDVKRGSSLRGEWLGLSVFPAPIQSPRSAPKCFSTLDMSQAQTTRTPLLVFFPWLLHCIEGEGE